MTNKVDQTVSILTQVVGAVDDVENTLQNTPSNEKKAAAMTALQDAITIATKNVPDSDRTRVTNTIGSAIDLVVALKNGLGLFGSGPKRAIKKSA